MPERAAGAAFADDDADDRRREPRHGEHALGDHLGLAAFLGADAGIGAGRVDHSDDRQAVLGGKLHLFHRFAIAFGMGAAEVALVPLFERFAFLMADEHHLEFVELREAGAEGAVVAEELVAVQLNELVEHQVDVVGEHWSFRMAGDANRFPRVEILVNRPHRLGELLAQFANLLADVAALGIGAFEIANLGFDLVDRLFERELKAGGHLGSFDHDTYEDESG